MPPRPTTSTYALLGLLSLRPWSAYELAQQATRSLRYAHPRTESHLYEEAKRLLRLGWATTEVEHHGRRSRTIYEITDDGGRALQDWFATPPRRLGRKLKTPISAAGTRKKTPRKIPSGRTSAQRAGPRRRSAAALTLAPSLRSFVRYDS